jgi:hypothetical protein
MITSDKQEKSAVNVPDLVKRLLVRGENKRKCTQFCTKLLLELNPSTEIQRFLVQKIIFGGWKLQRLAELETIYMSRQNAPKSSSEYDEYDSAVKSKRMRGISNIRVNSAELQDLYLRQTAVEKAFTRDLEQYRTEQKSQSVK